MRRGPSLVAGMALTVAGFAQVAPQQVALAAGNAACSGAVSDYQYASQSFFNAGLPHFVNDPQLTVNDLFAPPSTTSRDYDAIDEVCVKSTNVAIAGLPGTWTKVLIITGAANPSFPAASSGDLAAQFEVCARSQTPAQGNPTGIWRDAVVIGTGHRGEPIWDGPYPADEGWRGCTVATFGTDGINQTSDLGWTWQSPSNNSVFLDNANNQLAFPTANWAGRVVTTYLPNVVQWVIPHNPVLGGKDHTVSETVGLGVHGYELTTEAFATVSASIPTPPGKVCIDPPPLGTNTNCIQELLTLGYLVSWAPGKIQTVLPNAPTAHYAGIDLGLFPGGLPAGANAIQSCVDPGDTLLGDDNPEGPATTFPTASDLPTNTVGYCVQRSGVETYYPCADGANSPYPGNYGPQDPGDIWWILFHLLFGLTACHDTVGSDPGPGIPYPWEYDSENGFINGHDVPSVNVGAGSTANDHITNVFDGGLEGNYPPIGGVPQVHY